jgi:hypothetical protein
MKVSAWRRRSPKNALISLGAADFTTAGLHGSAATVIAEHNRRAARIGYTRMSLLLRAPTAGRAIERW